MEKVEKYRDCIKKILSEYAAYKPSYGDVEVQIIFDMERDRYQVIRVGWDNKQRVYGCSMHLDIKDGKIWVQHDGTENAIAANPDLAEWLKNNPEQAQRFEQLVKLGNSINRRLLPFGTARADWQNNLEMLGISIEDDPIAALLRGLLSWRTMLPRLASETIAKRFLLQDASIWILRTNQVGGYDPDIEPIAPTEIGW